VGHVARNNRLWQCQPGELLVIFEGPSTYISPGWYASKREDGRVVPTWNYAVVHAHCTMTAIHDPRHIVKLITDLTNQQESSHEDPWRVTDAPEDFTARLVANIVGMELAIQRIQGKWRVSQNHRAENRASVVQGLLAEGSDVAGRMAMLVEAGR
jgi:transcriptional regulator